MGGQDQAVGAGLLGGDQAVALGLAGGLDGEKRGGRGVRLAQRDRRARRDAVPDLVHDLDHARVAALPQEHVHDGLRLRRRGNRE